MKQKYFAFFVCSLTAMGLNAVGASYFVSTGGSDAGAGTQAQPWRTIQHAANVAVAGDTVIVSPGNYGEYVTTAADGAAASRITFLASPENDWKNRVTVKSFRIKHRFITVRGFDITGAADINNANVRIEPPGTYDNGSECIITNNTIRDTPLILSGTASFGPNYIHIRDAYEGTDFNTAGFTAGSPVFLGADSLYPYTNHGTAHTVLSNSVDGLTMYFTDSLLPDTGTNYWLAVAPGGDNSTFKGVLAPIGSSVGPSNIVISGNIFTNLFGPALIFCGNSNVIRGNLFTRLHGQYAMQIQGANADVGYNTILDSPNIEWFTPEEMNSAQHPAGGSYYDWQCNVTASFAPGVTNVDFHHNWIQNCDNQLTMIEANLPGDATSYGYQIRYCVFVGLYTGSFSRSGLTFDHCTFYRNAYTLEESTALGIGGVGGVVQTGLVMNANVFVDNGEHAHPANEYPYGLSSSSGYVLANNFSVASETMGWPATAPQIGALTNAGDPLFVNARNPLGPDGLAFTDDDGLRPMPNSMIAALGLGALPPMPSTNPIAHFTARLATPGWQEPTGTTYNPAWASLRPDQRGGVIRPWQTPEAIGQIPVTATFDASQSIDGMGTNNSGIRSYAWNFGDGQTALMNQPTVSHTFTTIGTNWVSLSIQTTSGASATYSNAYRTLSSVNAFYVAVTGSDTGGDGSLANPWRTIQKAADTVSAGATVLVQPGLYDEWVRIQRGGTAGAPIVFQANGPVTNLGTFYLKSGSSYITLNGFDLTMQSTSNKYNSAIVIASSGVSNCWFINNRIHDTPNLYPFGGFSMEMSGATSAVSGLVISNNQFYNVAGLMVDLQGVGQLVVNNWFSNSWGSDAFGVWGHDHVIRGNFCTKIGSELVALSGAGNQAVNGAYWDNLALRSSTGHSVWTNASGYAVYQDSSYGSDGYSNSFNLVDTATLRTVYASAPDMSATWTMWRANIVSAPTSGVGAVEHPDFIQTFGPLANPSNPTWGLESYNILVEQNTVLDGVGGAIAQLECNNGTNAATVYGWTFQNNVFANIELGASINIPNCKWYNNTFYRCAPNTGCLSYGWTSPLSADPRGESYGGACSNNAFIACAYLNSNPGAYSGSANGYTPSPPIDLYLNCDYNFICDTNFASKAAGTVWPITDPFRFYEPHGINGGNPGLVNAAANDFHIAANSVLIDKGATVLGVTTDRDGLSRPQGTSFDIGAYEYQNLAITSAPPHPPTGLRVIPQ